MRAVVLVLFYLCISFSLWAQTEKQAECLESIQKATAKIEFPRYEGKVTINNDTIHFDRSMIILTNSESEAFQIFKNGILAPSIISSASTRPDRSFKTNSIEYIGKMLISNFHRIYFPNQNDSARIYTFLLWNEGIANPLLYILKLKYDETRSSNGKVDFIKGAKIEAFGFCSVLI